MLAVCWQENWNGDSSLPNRGSITSRYAAGMSSENNRLEFNCGRNSGIRVTCVENGCNRDEVSWEWGKLELSHSQINIFRLTLKLRRLRCALCALFIGKIRSLNKGWPTRWHLLYYLLLNMFQTLIRPSSGACDYLLSCVGWLEACWCYVAGLSVGDVVSECRLNHRNKIIKQVSSSWSAFIQISRWCKVQ